MLKIHTRNFETVTVLCLEGRIVHGETRTLRDAVQAESRSSVIVLDLGRVDTIDARGLGVMLELRRQTESRGVRFRLMNVNRFVRRVLEITRLDSVFEIIPKAEPSPATSPRTRSVSRMELAPCA